MAARTFDLTAAFVAESCITCGILFGIPGDFHAALQRKGSIFYCPNGHSMTYGQSEEDRLRAKLRAAEAAATAARDQAAAARRHAEHEAERRATAERSAAAYRGQVTRLRERAAKGQCPCCLRSFADLARHMVSQHPDYTTEPIDEGVEDG